MPVYIIHSHLPRGLKALSLPSTIRKDVKKQFKGLFAVSNRENSINRIKFGF